MKFAFTQPETLPFLRLAASLPKARADEAELQIAKDELPKATAEHRKAQEIVQALLPSEIDGRAFELFEQMRRCEFMCSAFRLAEANLKTERARQTPMLKRDGDEGVRLLRQKVLDACPGTRADRVQTTYGGVTKLGQQLIYRISGTQEADTVEGRAEALLKLAKEFGLQLPEATR